jgi:hypothetical protein
MESVRANALAILDERNDEGIRQVLFLGWNTSRDALLEVVVLLFDDGREMAIHAMKMQRRYRRYLPRSQ